MEALIGVPQRMLDSFDKFMNYAGITTAGLILLVPAWWWYKHQKFKQDFGEATYRPLFAPLSLLGMVFGLGVQFTWDQRFTLYKGTKRELITMEPTIWGAPIMYTNSMEVMRQISGGGGTAIPWHKPAWAQTTATYWGKSLLTVNDLQWRKHRKVLQPSFNPKLYEMVWKETARFFNEMVVVDHWPKTCNEATAFKRAQTFTQRIALCVILSCGFGLPISYGEKTCVAPGFSLDDGITFQGDNILLVAQAPWWLFHFPINRLRYIRKATQSMKKWFNESIASKKAEIGRTLAETNGDMDAESLKRDIFSRLTLASQMDGKSRLEDSEIIGNTWAMYFAGHDTTAGVLAAVFCLLAVHKDQQNIMLEEIREAVADTVDGQLSFEHYDSLVKTRSVFVEALRLYPAGSILIRETREDTVLKVPCGTDADGRIIEESVPIPKGTSIVGDMIGMQYNPRPFPEPEAFRPSRWYGASTEEQYTAFSGGPRACIGRRFALVEGVCFLAHVIRDFEVEPLLERGMTLEAWKEEVLNRAETRMTLSISESPLLFRRRPVWESSH